MIKVTDDFLPEKAFNDLQNYCFNNDFIVNRKGDKDFLVLETPRDLLDFLRIDEHQLVLTFIRKAYKDFDNEWRIHADNIINGYNTELASVLYINKKEEVQTNGTAFWIHDKHGKSLPKDISEEEFNRLLIEDSNDSSKWEMDSVIGNHPNRQVVYNSNYFHSKFPNEIEVGERIVLVCFYKKTIK